MHKNEKESIIDFLNKPEFKKWVLRPTEESNYFWSRYIKEHPELESAVYKAREIIIRTRFRLVKLEKEENEEILTNIIKISAQRQFHRNAAPIFYNKMQFALKVAAIIIFFVCGLSLYQNGNLVFKDGKNIANEKIAIITKSNPKGKKSRITLPDGSLVWLNSESELSFPEKFTSERFVALKGEAFFDVKKNPDKPFRVKTHNVITTALGTSFNINTFSQDIEIALVSGLIAVQNNENSKEEELRVMPGQKAVFYASSKSLELSSYNDFDFLKWKDGVISFKDATMPDIKVTLERWYGVELRIKNSTRKIQYTGDFENESLERVLERIAFSEDFNFTINKKTVTINFK